MEGRVRGFNAAGLRQHFVDLRVRDHDRPRRVGGDAGIVLPLPGAWPVPVAVERETADREDGSGDGAPSAGS